MRPAHRAVIVHNAAARRAVPRARLDAAARAFAGNAWAIEVREAASPEETAAVAAGAAAEGLDAILACGGDGTLNCVLQGVRRTLAERDGAQGGAAAPAVGVVPGGTGNVWAQEAGIPARVEDAVRMLEGGRRYCADLGLARIGDGPARRFLLMCGAGIDASVVEAVDRNPVFKRHLGRAAFAWPGLTAIAMSDPVETSIEVDGETATLPLHQAIAGNSRLFAGVARLASAAMMDDGLLDLVTFAAPMGAVGRARAFQLAARALAGGLDRSTLEGIGYQRGSHIVLRPASDLPVQVDGESLGQAGPEAPLTITVELRAVTLIVGERADRLFSAVANRD